MVADSSVPVPIPVSTAEKICDACVRKVGTVKAKTIRAQDPLSKFGIEDKDAIEDLVNAIVNDKKIGAPSEGYKIPDPNKLHLKGSTTFAQLEDSVIASSQAKKAPSGAIAPEKQS
jgi:hypothetical protein